MVSYHHNKKEKKTQKTKSKTPMVSFDMCLLLSPSVFKMADLIH